MALALIGRLAEPRANHQLFRPSDNPISEKKNSNLGAGNLWNLEVVQPED